MSDPRKLIEIGKNGVCQFRGAPRYGHQDVGISPAGALDRFALQTGNLLLDNPAEAVALELVFPPHIRIARPCYFVLCGAHFDVTLRLPGESPVAVSHAAVHYAPAGAELRFGRKLLGFRAYLCLRPEPDTFPDERLLSRRRGEFREVFSWPDPLGKIRLLEGPEHAWLRHPEQFFRQRWQVSTEVSDMGLRLAGGELNCPAGRSMVSDAVADGTVQLTPSGPIVLLRHRQTVGGYPRIFNVISADVDLLAQLGPGRFFRFRPVSLTEALAVERLKQLELQDLCLRISS